MARLYRILDRLDRQTPTKLKGMMVQTLGLSASDERAKVRVNAERHFPKTTFFRLRARGFPIIRNNNRYSKIKS